MSQSRANRSYADKPGPIAYLWGTHDDRFADRGSPTGADPPPAGSLFVDGVSADVVGLRGTVRRRADAALRHRRGELQRHRVGQSARGRRSRRRRRDNRHDRAGLQHNYAEERGDLRQRKQSHIERADRSCADDQRLLPRPRLRPQGYGHADARSPENHRRRRQGWVSGRMRLRVRQRDDAEFNGLELHHERV